MLSEAALPLHSHSGWPEKGTVRLLCPPGETTILHVAPMSRLKVSTSGLLLLRRLLPSLFRVSIRTSSAGREDRRCPFHWALFVFTLANQSTCLSCKICSRVHRSTQTWPPQSFLQQFPWQPAPSQRAHRATVSALPAFQK